MIFYYAYVLQSLSKNFIYIGYTSNLKKRLLTHNSKQVNSTQYYAPLKLIFFEGYASSRDAKRREKYFKTTKGKTSLRTMLIHTIK